MADLNVNSIGDASGGNTATINGYAPTLSNMAGRNKIINGDMRIDQRNAGASVTPTTTNTYPVDRWLLNITSTYHDVTTVQQNLNSLTLPDGFTNYIGVVVNTGTAAESAPFYNVRQIIEGLNTSDLGWGTASAKSITLSFWVRASITGTYTAGLRSGGGGVAYIATYTISSANTWEYKTITIPGATSGTWATDNTSSITLSFGLANNSGTYATSSPNEWIAGSFTGATSAVEILSTTGATFYITGVQLEAGSVATPFEYRQYGTELQLCQRYYEKARVNLRNFATDSNQYIRPIIQFSATKRTAPTVTFVAGGNAGMEYNGSNNQVYPETVGLDFRSTAANNSAYAYGTFYFDAEL